MVIPFGLRVVFLSEGHERTVVLVEDDTFHVFLLLFALYEMILPAVFVCLFSSEGFDQLVTDVLVLKERIFVHYNDKFYNYMD
jgi:hypothetical protein